MRHEGQMTVDMISPIEGAAIKLCTQVTKVTRPLLSVTKITEGGKLRVVCDQEQAVIIDKQNKVLATVPEKNGLYVCVVKVKNPKYKNREPFLRQLPWSTTIRAYDPRQQHNVRWSSPQMAGWRLERMTRT